MRDTTAAGLEATIREYFDACNAADADAISACFEPDGVHYFPAGAPQGTFVGAKAIAAGWVNAVRNLGSIWTIDHVIVDEQAVERLLDYGAAGPHRHRVARSRDTGVGRDREPGEFEVRHELHAVGNRVADGHFEHEAFCGCDLHG